MKSYKTGLSEARLRYLHRYLQFIQSDNGISAAASGIGRIIAKIDPIFGTSEFDPDRVAAAKKLEEEIIAKLKAEAAARNKSNV